MKKTIVLGVGNPILGDDGVGLHVINELKKRFDDEDIIFEKSFTGGMNLLDQIVDHDRAILIDAVKMSGQKPGDVGLYRLDELSAFSNTFNPHDLSLPQAIDMAKQLGNKNIPKDIKIIGINVGEMPKDFSEELSPDISKAVTKAVRLVEEEVGEKADE